MACLDIRYPFSPCIISRTLLLPVVIILPHPSSGCDSFVYFTEFAFYQSSLLSHISTSKNEIIITARQQRFTKSIQHHVLTGFGKVTFLYTMMHQQQLYSFTFVSFFLAFATMTTTTTAFQPNFSRTKIGTASSSSSFSLQASNNKATSSPTETKRQPWDVFRFAQQSSKFVNIIPTVQPVRAIQPGDVLWRPNEKKQDFTFAPLDDVVMGGASSSRFDSKTGQWMGQVTDANNGGFIGIRSTPSNLQLDFSKCRGIEVQMKSNKNKNQRLKIGLRDNAEFNGLVWNTSVDIPGFSNRIRIPFDKLIPTQFAQVVKDAPSFDKTKVSAFQLTYTKFEYNGKLNSKFQVGDVDIQVEEIRAY